TSVTAPVGSTAAEGPAAATDTDTDTDFAIDDALAGGAELLEVLFDRAPLGVAVYGPDLRLHRFNRTFAQLAERHGGAAKVPVEVGHKLLEYFPRAEAKLRAVASLVLAGETRWYRGVAHELGGVTSYWDLVLVPLRRGDDVIGIVQIATDAT